MSDSSANYGAALAAFERIVVPWMRKKTGRNLSELLLGKVKNAPRPDCESVKDCFSELCRNLISIQLKGYSGPVLRLLLEADEYELLFDNLSSDFVSYYEREEDFPPIDKVFEQLLAPELVDVLGEELVDHLNQLYLDEVEQQVGVADHNRFLVAMSTLAETVPLLSEVEFTEKIQAVAEILEKHNTGDQFDSGEGIAGFTLDDGIKEVIIPDLADILGEGPILFTLVDDVKHNCRGIFPDELARFSRFIKEINKSDIIINMFGDHWAVEKEKEWLDSFQNKSS